MTVPDDDDDDDDGGDLDGDDRNDATEMLTQMLKRLTTEDEYDHASAD